jgi:hypothetical protein
MPTEAQRKYSLRKANEKKLENLLLQISSVENSCVSSVGLSELYAERNRLLRSLNRSAPAASGEDGRRHQNSSPQPSTSSTAVQDDSSSYQVDVDMTEIPLLNVSKDFLFK